MVTGVPEKMGIGWEVLSKIRPDLVMLSCSGFGLTGPYAKRVTMGGAMDGIAGYGALRHYPDQAPDTVNYSTRTDVVTGMTNAVAILTALAQRQRTGRGQQVEVSGVEASLHHRQGEGPLDFVAGTDAARARDAGGVVEREKRIRVIAHGGPSSGGMGGVRPSCVPPKRSR